MKCSDFIDSRYSVTLGCSSGTRPHCLNLTVLFCWFHSWHPAAQVNTPFLLSFTANKSLMSELGICDMALCSSLVLGVCIALPVTSSASPVVFQPLFWKSCAVSPVCVHCASFWLQFPSPICDVSCVFDVSLPGVSCMSYFSSGQSPMQDNEDRLFQLPHIAGVFQDWFNFGNWKPGFLTCTFRSTIDQSALWEPPATVFCDIWGLSLNLRGSLIFW